MEGKYIFAIVILGLFFLLIFVSFAFLEYARIKEEKLQSWIDERYAGKDLSKVDYDTVQDDEDVPAQTAPKFEASDEKEPAEAEPVIDASYGKIDVEGIEEITGNYGGDKN